MQMNSPKIDETRKVDIKADSKAKFEETKQLSASDIFDKEFNSGMKAKSDFDPTAMFDKEIERRAKLQDKPSHNQSPGSYGKFDIQD